jgi:hypothetical protein
MRNFLTRRAAVELVCCGNANSPTVKSNRPTANEQKDVKTVPLLAQALKCSSCKLIHQFYKHRPAGQALLWSFIAHCQQCGNGLLSAADRLLTWHNSLSNRRHQTLSGKVTRAVQTARDWRGPLGYTKLSHLVKKCLHFMESGGPLPCSTKPAIVTILRQLSPSHTPSPYLCKSSLILYFHQYLRFHSGLRVFPSASRITSHVSHACFMHWPSHRRWFNHNVWSSRPALVLVFLDLSLTRTSVSGV